MVELTCQKLGCTVPTNSSPLDCCRTPSAQKTILQSVSGVFKSGELWAVMGPSGSGKSTFLNAIGNRISRHNQYQVSGAVLVDGVPLNDSIGKEIGFVMQNDVLNENLTVRETFGFVLRLREGALFSTARMNERVSQVISDLGLECCADTVIGNGGLTGNTSRRGLSGGERKRVSIGIELLRDDPKILLLDEPTSGLDSSTALHLISILRRLATQRNQLIICTLHQPQSRIFKMLDKVFLLSHGKTIYMGDASSAPQYFGALGYPCRKMLNPADHMLELISIDCRSFEAEMDSIKRINSLAMGYSNSLLCQDNREEAMLKNPLKAAQSHSWLRCGTWAVWKEFLAFLILLQRNFLDQFRSRLLMVFRFCHCVVLALMMTAFYCNMSADIDFIQDRRGALFYIILQQACSSLMLVVTIFHTEKQVYFREYGQGLYSTLSYFLAKCTSEIPFVIPAPIIFALIAFPLSGLQLGFDHLSLAILCLIFVSFSAQGNGLLISALCPSIALAQIATPLVIVTLLMFGGLFLNVDNIPFYFKFIGYINYIKYGYEIISYDQLSTLEITCSEETRLRHRGCPISSGMQVLEQMSMDRVDVYSNFGQLLILILSFYFVAFLTLKLKSYRY